VVHAFGDLAFATHTIPFLAACTYFLGAEFKDFYDQIPVILRELLYRLNDDDASVLQATNLAFAALSKEVSAEELVNHVEFMRNLIASMVSEARRRKGGVGDGEFLLPGFNMPKGTDSFLWRRIVLDEYDDRQMESIPDHVLEVYNI
jgi:hypothetical protein